MRHLGRRVRFRGGGPVVCRRVPEGIGGDRVYMWLEEAGLIVGTPEWKKKQIEKCSGLREQDPEQRKKISSAV